MSIVVVLAERGTHTREGEKVVLLPQKHTKNAQNTTRRMNTALTWLKHVSKYIKFVLNQCITFHKLGCFKASLVYKMSRFLRQKMSTITAIINPVTQRVMRDP